MMTKGDELGMRNETILGEGADVILAWSMPLVLRWSRDRLELIQTITIGISGADESLGWVTILCNLRERKSVPWKRQIPFWNEFFTSTAIRAGAILFCSFIFYHISIRR